MPRPTTETERLDLRCPKELKAKLVAAARLARQSLTAYILTAAEERAARQRPVTPRAR
jgi:uncharacterized protein (DUF1778 family)